MNDFSYWSFVWRIFIQLFLKKKKVPKYSNTITIRYIYSLSLLIYGI